MLIHAKEQLFRTSTCRSAVTRSSLVLLGMSCCVPSARALAPAGVASASFGSPLAELPLTVRDGTAQVHASLGPNIEGDFAVDSGSTITAISPRIAERAGILLGDAVHVRGMVGGLEFRKGHGTVSIHAGTAVVVVRDPLVGECGTPRTPVDGILGAALFRVFVVQLDYPARRLRLFDPESFRPRVKIPELTLTMLEGLPCLELKLTNGRDERTAKCDVDTGFGGGLILDRASAACTVVSTFTGSYDKIAGTRGELEIEHGFCRRGFLGRFSFPIYDLDLFPGGNGETIRGLDGTIGYRILRQFRVTFDYRRNRILLQAASGYAIFQPGPFGIWIGQGPPYEVSGVNAGSPAARAGIAVGDRVLRIDKLSTTLLTKEDLVEAIRHRTSATQLELERIVQWTKRPLRIIVRCRDYELFPSSTGGEQVSGPLAP